MTKVAVIGDSGQTRREMRDMAEAGHEVVWVTGDDRFEVPGVHKELADLRDADDVAKRVSGARFCVIASDDLVLIELALAATSSSGAVALIASQRAETYESLVSSGVDSAAVFGVRWTPGVSGVLAKLAASELGETRSARISWLTSIAGPMGPDRLHDVLAALAGGVVFEGGEWRRISGKLPSEEVYLPEPFGWREVFRCAGVESACLPSTIGVTDKVTVACATSGRMSRMLRALARSAGEDPASWKARAGIALATSVPYASENKVARIGWAALRVDVGGDDAGQVSFAILDELNHLQSATLLASVTCLRDVAITGGVKTLEQVVDPQRFTGALASRGVRIARLTR